MFLDWGDGWVAVNDHDNDVAALDGFSIQWGTDDLAEQPEPSVMSFTLRDRTGWLTGRALTLAGARVLVQISEQPTWGMLRDDMGPWSAQHMRVEAMHQAYTPGLPSSTSSTAITLFDGLVQNGGDARPHDPVEEIAEAGANVIRRQVCGTALGRRHERPCGRAQPARRRRRRSPGLRIRFDLHRFHGGL